MSLKCFWLNLQVERPYIVASRSALLKIQINRQQLRYFRPNSGARH